LTDIIKNFFKTTLYTVTVTIFALALLEFLLLTVGEYRETTSGNPDCKTHSQHGDFSIYRQDCSVRFKHWEQEKEIEYSFNAFGRREPQSQNPQRLIAFIGDSFTMGAMVPINKNYNYVALRLLDRNYGGHNYGVGGAQFRHVVARLEKIPIEKYDYIVYGLTPNDLFDLVDGTSNSKADERPTESIENEQSRNSSMVVVEKLLSTAIARFLLHTLLNVDSVYYKIYMARRPYSGYLQQPVSAAFVEALDHAFRVIANLPENIRSKIVLMLLPQRAEIAAVRLGQQYGGLQAEVRLRCEIHNIRCAFTDMGALAELERSHFAVDGHLTEEGNASVGEDLSKYLARLP
jgi:hypothetical protein